LTSAFFSKFLKCPENTNFALKITQKVGFLTIFCWKSFQNSVKKAFQASGKIDVRILKNPIQGTNNDTKKQGKAQTPRQGT